VKSARFKRGALIFCVVLLILFLARPGVNRLHARITGSISRALGRPVDVTAVKLRFLPQPGFDLEGFVVHDDPSFSSEPMLRADDVTASLRFVSLLFGRLEIARLSLNEPSLNLVRNDTGRWNLENLLERADTTRVAPTAKTGRGPRAGFPYIEASRARINFKLGLEKKPYAVTDADFALWQASENAWSLRLKATPVRTDSSLSDTGTIRVSGTWQRSASLRDTPLQFELSWERAQLGQLTKLLFDQDKGWRGTVRLAATLTGTPAQLDVDSGLSLDDFRRYDIISGGNLYLSARCRSKYNAFTHTFSNLACLAPFGDGSIDLAGILINPFGKRSFDLEVAARQLPVQALAIWAQRAKRDMPDDLVAAGTVDARLRLRGGAKSGGALDRWQGVGEVSGIHLASALTNTDLGSERIPLALSAGSGTVRARSQSQLKRRAVPPENEPYLEVGPFSVDLGRNEPAFLYGWISHSGYRFAIQGDAKLQRLLRAARTVGLAAPQSNANGDTNLDLAISGLWAGFSAPQVTGLVQLRSARVPVRGWNLPLEVSSANIVLTEDQTEVKNLAASVAGEEWRGSVELPRPCPSAQQCLVQFKLHAGEISADQLNMAMNPEARKRAWYHFLSPSSNSGNAYLLGVQAAGTITADRLVVRRLTATHVSADARLQDGLLQLINLRGEVLGGKHLGDWKADFTRKPPQYSGSGTFERVSLGQLSSIMNDAWVTGSASGSYRAMLSGSSTAELASSASGALQVEVRDGMLPHIALAGANGPLEMGRLSLRLALANGKFVIENGELQTPLADYRVAGAALLDRSLSLKLSQEGKQSINITGTLGHPLVSTGGETQASLKP